MSKLLKKNKGRFIQEFRNDYPDDYCWMMKKYQKEIYKPLIEKYLKRQR